MRRPTISLLARGFGLLALLLAAAPAFGWSALGHRLVGELAQRQLEPAAQAEVACRLEGEAEPTLAGVAVWADDLRSSSPEDYKRTSRWHYINTPEGTCTADMARDCPDGECVVGAIEAQQRLLADASQPLAVRRDALKFVVHFVGDVHQPMHANNRPDLGGNRFAVSLRTPVEPEEYARSRYVDGLMSTNLHSIWDYYVLAGAGLDLPAYARRLDLGAWPSSGALASGPLAWAGESCRLIDARGLYPASGRIESR
jgi:nuclease S1